MMSTNLPEFWLRGPVAQVPAILQPVAHALLQAADEIQDVMIDFPEDRLWIKPAGLASVAFHLQHLTGVLDRLFTYAKGESLQPSQLDYLATEGLAKPGITKELLVQQFSQQVNKSMEQLIATDETTVVHERKVGRKQLPSTVIGLLFHAAEHTMRHNGQLLVTVKFLQQQHLTNS